MIQDDKEQKSLLDSAPAYAAKLTLLGMCNGRALHNTNVPTWKVSSVSQMGRAAPYTAAWVPLVQCSKQDPPPPKLWI